MNVYRILLAGDDLRLLETRAAVLGRTGAMVRWAARSEVELLLRQEHFDLLIFCHTLPMEQRERLTAFARQRWPRIFILQLVSTIFEEQAADRKSDIRMSGCEPRQLVCRIEMLLKEIPPRISQPRLFVQQSAG
jgi:DNA-binding response OmpR family regulator